MSAYSDKKKISNINRGGRSSFSGIVEESGAAKGYEFISGTEDGGYSIWRSPSTGKYIVMDVYERVMRTNIGKLEDAVQLADELEAKDHMYR